MPNKPNSPESQFNLGIERAAAWHGERSKIFRDAIESRKKYGIDHGELLWRAEEHESAASQILGLKRTNVNEMG